MRSGGVAAFQATVHGRVQEVGFRDFVQRRARFLGLSGYVRNLQDGSLEVIAEGNRNDLEQLLEYLHEGPRLARVQRVDVQWRQPTGAYHDFGVGF